MRHTANATLLLAARILLVQRIPQTDTIAFSPTDTSRCKWCQFIFPLEK